MKNFTTTLCILALVFTTACGGNGDKTATSGADQGTFFVNRIDETTLDDGTKEYVGNVGIVANVNGGSKEANMDILNEAAKSDQVLYLNEDELRINGLTLGDNVAVSEQVAPIFWFGLGFILGAWAGETSARSAHYNNYAVNYYGHTTCRTCYNTCTTCAYKRPVYQRPVYQRPVAQRPVYQRPNSCGHNPCGNNGDYNYSTSRTTGVTTTNTYFSYSH